MKSILMIVGSLRKQSFNHQLAKKVEEKLSSQAYVEFLDYANIPLMNQDLENPDVESIASLKEKVARFDACWIFVPEYNGSYPGVLKNLLDWLSRSSDPSDYTKTCVYQKPVTISGVGGGKATANAQAKLLELLGFMNMKVMDTDRIQIALEADEWASNILAMNESRQQMIQKQVKAFLDYIED